MPIEGQRIAVIGGGSLGLYVGGMLALAGHQVDIGGRKATELPHHVTAEGDDVWHAAARFTTVDALRGPYDQVVVAVKSYDLEPLLPRLADLGGTGAQCVFLQNGVPWWWAHVHAGGAVADVAGAIPLLQRTVAVVVHHAVERIAPGRIRVRRASGERYLCGRPLGGRDARLDELVKVWQAAGIPAEGVADIGAEMWGKLMGNATLNPLSAITGATIGELAERRETREVLLAGMEEVARIAVAEGHPPTSTPLERVARAALVGAVRTSMLQDRIEGRRLETEALLAAPIALAQTHGISVPVLRTLLAGLCFVPH